MRSGTMKKDLRMAGGVTRIRIRQQIITVDHPAGLQVLPMIPAMDWTRKKADNSSPAAPAARDAQDFDCSAFPPLPLAQRIPPPHDIVEGQEYLPEGKIIVDLDAGLSSE